MQQARLSTVKQVMRLSKAWLDTVETDPREIRDYGLKGKKKLVELFDAYLTVYPFVPKEQQKDIDLRLNRIARITQTPGYHDMNSIEDAQFDEDSLSYLRLCYLLARKGFNTDIYQQGIKKMIPRLNARMAQRGANQQMTFDRYYNFFHIKEPFPLVKSFENGIIAQRITPQALDEMDVYRLTHEIFAVYEYGDRPQVDFFTKDDRIYLRSALTDLIRTYIGKRDLDLAAELITCMSLLNWQSEPICNQAIAFLLSGQNPDGSFGNYESLRVIYEGYVKEGFYLHTTSVALKALSLTVNITGQFSIIPGQFSRE